jgi:hypothetical protein
MAVGQSLKTSPALLEMMSRADTGAEQFPVLAKAPLYIQESLLFPYTAGIRFQHKLYVELGQAAFPEVFRNPPVSSQQILHPELYRKGVKPTEPEVPALASLRGYRSWPEERSGKSIIRFCGSTRASGGQTFARLARGFLRLLEHKDGRTVALMFRMGRQRGGRVFVCMSRCSEEADDGGQRTPRRELRGRGDDGWFVVTLKDRRVSAAKDSRSPKRLPVWSKLGKSNWRSQSDASVHCPGCMPGSDSRTGRGRCHSTAGSRADVQTCQRRAGETE